MIVFIRGRSLFAEFLYHSFRGRPVGVCTLKYSYSLEFPGWCHFNGPRWAQTRDHSNEPSSKGSRRGLGDDREPLFQIQSVK